MKKTPKFNLPERMIQREQMKRRDVRRRAEGEKQNRTQLSNEPVWTLLAAVKVDMSIRLRFFPESESESAHKLPAEPSGSSE